jgi:membrane-associated phospholipid phosphatase
MVRNTSGARPSAAPGAFTERFVRRRPVIVAVYVTVSAGLVAGLGLPERPYLLVWLLGLLVLTCWHSQRRGAQLVIDWLPLLVVLAAYDVVRDLGESLIPRAHLQPQLDFDEWIGGGVAPTVRLQDALFDPDNLRWYDYACFAVYLTHFLAAITVGVVIYFRARHRFHRFAYTFLGCSLAGFATYVIYPAIPPWLASKQGALPPTTRAVDSIWDHLGVHFLQKVFSGDPKYSNPVGAIPSEHAAYPLIFLLLFWAVANRPWRIVLVLYTLVMAFALVYLAEHYVFDIVLGWVYAVVAFLVVGRLLDRRSAGRLAGPPSPLAASPSAPPEPALDAGSGEPGRRVVDSPSAVRPS